MLRQEIEQQMKTNKQTQIDLVINQNDKYGVMCFLKGGFLTDAWGHRIDRKANIWGYLKWINGKPIRTAF